MNSRTKKKSPSSQLDYNNRHSEVDSTGSYRDQPDYGKRHSVVDSAESYNPYMDYSEGYAEYGERAEYSDISLRSDLGSDYGEDPQMEVEEVLHGDCLTDSEVHSIISGNDKPLARTIPAKAPPRAYNPGTCTPVPKPHRGKGEATPVPTPETGKVTGAPPEMGARKLLPPKSARGNPPQAEFEHYIQDVAGYKCICELYQI
ncbi:hypothetical protein P4O66_003565 [Electrophorus voltai]|uniref:Uncharacterized protein n=1 Tax=Electrophorus voltai TaxID=2609070 RepID=A0AAD9E513_9TELE|nr:hypothetical protein P4O66_003565 [Electrophorus voltai]